MLQTLKNLSDKSDKKTLGTLKKYLVNQKRFATPSLILIILGYCFPGARVINELWPELPS